MTRSFKSMLLSSLLAVAASGTASQAAAPFELTLDGPASFYPGQSHGRSFTGTLSAATVGVPSQTIEIFVDGLIAGTAATTLQGTYAISLPPFSGTSDRLVKATAFGGTPFETSAEILVEVVRFNLTVSFGGPGSGTITSNPPGISCPSQCSATFPATSLVELSAAPNPGSMFAGWSGSGCAGTGICQINMINNVTVLGSFSPNLHTLSVSRSGAGTGTIFSSPSGINCGSDCVEQYPQGTMVNLAATANPGSIFIGWIGGGCSGVGPCVVSMNSATSVVATFSLSQFQLTVSKSGPGSGTVTSTPSGIFCGATCSAIFNSGTFVTLTASAGMGSSFAGWAGACTGTGSCNVVINNATNVSATFV